MLAYVFLLATFALLWLIVLRPQKNRIREHQALTAALVEGDEIVTNGGLYGTIAALDGEVVHLEVAPGLVLRVARGAVAARVSDDDRAQAAEAESSDAAAVEATLVADRVPGTDATETGE